jgi:copper chaperone CopZ
MDKPVKAQGEEVLETRRIGIEGMSCDHCARRVENALRGVAGVKDVRVDRLVALATVTFDSTKANLAALEEALRKSGYPPTTAIPGTDA